MSAANARMPENPPVDLTPARSVTPEEALAVADGTRGVRLSPDIPDGLPASPDDIPVYGVTTGFGSLADRPASRDSGAHQRALVSHLATGTGEPLPPRVVRLMVVDRLVTLSRGVSGVRRCVLEDLVALLEAANEHLPRIPRYGSVGASGDLTPLAHLALWMADQGTTFAGRDALALVNGTSASLGLVLSAWDQMSRLIAPLIESAAVMVRAQDLAEQAYDERIHHLR